MRDCVTGVWPHRSAPYLGTNPCFLMLSLFGLQNSVQIELQYDLAMPLIGTYPDRLKTGTQTDIEYQYS